MNRPTLLLVVLATPFSLIHCNRDQTASKPKEPNAASKISSNSDVPLLPVKKGDRWIYDVRLEIPSGVTSSGAAAVEKKFVRTRTYVGKVVPSKGLPEVDCFEVTVPGSPTELEYVDLLEDRILMRGSHTLRDEETKPMFFESPIPLISADMKPGTESPEIRTAEGSMFRKIKVVARESVDVPAGKYQSIRLLMTGTDGGIELRRTIWFSPGVGIVKEEKSRYRGEKLLFREEHSLSTTKPDLRISRALK